MLLQLNLIFLFISILFSISVCVFFFLNSFSIGLVSHRYNPLWGEKLLVGLGDPTNNFFDLNGINIKTQDTHTSVQIDIHRTFAFNFVCFKLAFLYLFSFDLSEWVESERQTIKIMKFCLFSHPFPFLHVFLTHQFWLYRFRDCMFPSLSTFHPQYHFHIIYSHVYEYNIRMPCHAMAYHTTSHHVPGTQFSFCCHNFSLWNLNKR